MKDWLPAYAAGALRGPERDRLRAHLEGCAGCRAELAAWQGIAAAAAPAEAPPDPERLVRAVLHRSAFEEPAVRRSAKPNLAALMLAELRLIRFAVPIASALVLALGVALVLLRSTAPIGAGPMLGLVAPVVAAAGIAGTYRSRRDPVAELIGTMPTPGRLLVLIRIALVFGYDLVLTLAAAAGLGVGVRPWLGPMVLLSALSLLAAVRFGPDVALAVAVGLWVVRVMAGGLPASDGWPARFVVSAWSTNAPVLVVAAAVAVAAIVLAGEPRDGWRATNPM
ncbi:anti-sigma factor [Dactylosporangium sp. NPDC051541]|uniref:anti-sigma factor n=1 Tax=Dactylosporangium sp. NPDC051541 TaxID=3363977 RepID=UPI00378CC181